MWKSFISRIAVLAIAALSAGCSVLEPQRAAPVEAPVIDAAPMAPIAISDSILMPELRQGTVETYAKAVTQLREGDVASAEKMLMKLTKRQPELAGPWLNLGHLHLRQGDEEAAREAFMQALEANPQSCHAHTQLGVLLRRAGEFEAARSHYRSCLAAQPDFGVAHLNLGILSELYLGDLQTALTAYERYLEVTPDAEPRVKGWVADLRRRTGV